MSRLVQDLVEDIRPNGPGFSIQLGSCDLVALAREQLEVAAARSKQHKLVLDAPDRLEVNCDRERVAQVLANLLGNAIAYSARGEVQVRVFRDGDTARVSVHDSGPGIPVESLEMIFEPRVRLRSEPGRPRAQGAGLGLSIARDIVEAHGGRIWADSAPGQGAAFNVSLPIARSGRRPSHALHRAGPTASRQRAGSRIRVG
jgi:two-component system, OmpR family, sensor histidine kinase MtrB